MKGTRWVVLGLMLALAIAPYMAAAQSLGELVQQGNGLQDAQKYPEAESVWRKVIQLDPKNAVAFSNLCDALYRQNKLDEAMGFCREAIALDPQLSDAYKNLGNVLSDQKKLDEALAAYRRSVEINPKNARAYNNIGLILIDQGKLDEAIAQFRKAIALDPRSVPAYNNLGNALSDQGKLEEAIASFRQAIALDPKLAIAYNGLGNALSDQKKLEDAITAYRQAIALDPKYASPYNNLGVAVYNQGKLEEAIAAYRQAIALDPKYATAYYNLGNALSNQQKLEEAIASFRQAIALNSKYASAYNNLGKVLSDQGKQEEAIAAYRQAIALNPKDASAYNNLGVAVYNQGKLEDAIAAYRQALSLPDDTTVTPTTTHTLAHNNLGLLLQEQGKLTEAISEFEKATQIDPKFDYAQNNLKEARRLLALQQQPSQLIALNETKYLPKDDPLTPIKRSIVKVSVVFSGNAKGANFGTGYVIKRQGDKVWIVTNRHVVIDKDTEQTGSNLEIELYYGEKLPSIPHARSTAKIVSVTTPDEQLDLALLEVTSLPTDIQPLAIRPGKIIPDAPLLVIGHPEAKDWSTDNGRFLNADDDGNLLISITIASGSSGSPVLDRDRYVIGIMVRTFSESTGIGIANPINLVVQKIAQWGIQIP